MNKRCGGSITIMAALSLMLVAQCLFTLLEAARNVEYHKLLQMNTDAVLESVFANYVSPLWDKYRLLGLRAENSEWMEEELSFNCPEAEIRELGEVNLGSQERKTLLGGSILLTAEITDAEFTSYLLMTDQQGAVFQAAVTAYMKNHLLYEAAQTVYSKFESVSWLKKEYGDGNAYIQDALSALDALKEESSDTTEAIPMGNDSMRKGGAPPKADSDSVSASPLTIVTEAKKQGVLSLVLPESAHVSGAKINLEDTVSHRTLEQGSGKIAANTNWYDQVLLNQYLTHYLSNYTDGVTDRGLNYELEYLIGGKDEDVKNLRLAVGEILAIREAMNLASLVMSAEKQALALSLATLLVGATLNPLIIAAVKYGLLAAWAFVESVLDLRALLAGEKVALIKNELDWTSDLDGISELLSGFAQAKSSPHGCSYRDYLGLLLFFGGSEKLSMRAMDVQEAAVRQSAGYENFRMDHIICEAAVCVTYSYVPVFAGFVSLLEERPEKFFIQKNSEYSYFVKQTSQ